jgi:hypothetical protein
MASTKMTRYLILAAILLITGLFITFRPKAPDTSELQSNGRDEPMRSTTESAVQLPDLAEPSRTKSKNRIHHPKPTNEETTALVRNTVIPLVDIQDQTVLEVAAAITTFLQDAGIPPHKLRVIVNKSDDLVKWRIKELRIRNAPLDVLLKFICDSTRLRYRVEPGIIRFVDAFDDSLPEIPKIEESSSPSGILPAPDDPFGESPAQGADPFAEPEIRSR